MALHNSAIRDVLEFKNKQFELKGDSVLGTSASSKHGFYGTTAVVQASGAAQAASSAPTAYTAPVAGGAVGVTSAAATDLDTAAAAIATLVAEVTTLTAEVNAIRTVLVNLGLMKGSA